MPPGMLHGEYITAIELVCQGFLSTEVEKHRADIYRVLRQPHPLKPNPNKKEWKALRQLKSDRIYIIWTADNGWLWL